MKVTETHVFFWGGIFSNWANIPNGIPYTTSDGEEMRFSNSEQLFMYLKAKCFGDDEIAEKIANTSDPKEAKKLGRKIKNFDDSIWANHREEAMHTAVYEKALNFKEFRDEILSEKYSGKGFVEASPYDTIWGIGMSEDEPNVDDETCWRGLNLLGRTLNIVRDELCETWRKS